MTFDKWLNENWKDDENRKFYVGLVEEWRNRVKEFVIESIDGSLQEICWCDQHIATNLMHYDRAFATDLVALAIGYLLGENFHGAAASYYYSWWKEYGRQ